MQDITADLRPPLDLLLLSFKFRLFFLTFLQFDIIETRLQDPEGILSVVQLGTCLGVLHDYTRRDMSHADSGLDLVDILSSGTAGPVCIPLKVSRIDLDLYAVIYKRIYEY